MAMAMAGVLVRSVRVEVRRIAGCMNWLHGPVSPTLPPHTPAVCAQRLTVRAEPSMESALQLPNGHSPLHLQGECYDRSPIGHGAAEEEAAWRAGGRSCVYAWCASPHPLSFQASGPKVEASAAPAADTPPAQLVRPKAATSAAQQQAQKPQPPPTAAATQEAWAKAAEAQRKGDVVEVKAIGVTETGVVVQMRPLKGG